ncbi:MAG: nucleotidyltransferase domain-containing protein [Ktedonobacterales bacterium]|nr:nucleotidyltransferase domain-containing protein [Ktedonobacterales bacterium]
MIEQSLIALEATHGIRILYACESGSRAWGFASDDSDYDVRFIFAYPRDRYLRLDDPRDTIEQMSDELDFTGWDIRKALRLLRNTNPALLEWLSSPIVYRSVGTLHDELVAISQRFHAPLAIHWHYLKMARGNFAQYIANPAERGERVLTKKYLYVVNPLAKLLYYERHHALPPLELDAALAGLALPTDLRAELEQLIALKRSGWELGRGPISATLNAWIVAEMTRLQASAPPPTKHPELTAILDELLTRVLAEG